MTSDIFEDYLQKRNRKLVHHNRHILLIADNPSLGSDWVELAWMGWEGVMVYLVSFCWHSCQGVSEGLHLTYPKVAVMLD